MYRGRCRVHARVRNRETRSANKATYSGKKWQMTRRRQLFDNPLCQWRDGCMEVATDVHHIVDLADGGAPYDFANLQSLCHAHHSSLTRASQVESMR